MTFFNFWLPAICAVIYGAGCYLIGFNRGYGSGAAFANRRMREIRNYTEERECSPSDR